MSLLIKGDNAAALRNLQKDYTGKIDLIYVDIPFNTGNEFKGKKTISRANDSALAYSDKMPFPEYLEFIKSRLELARPLLSNQGSIYLHIDTKVGHYIKVKMDEVFGPECFRNDITRIKSNPKNFKRKAWGNQKDTILFYAMSRDNIWNDVRQPLTEIDRERYNKEDERGYYTTVPCHAPGETANGPTGRLWKGMLPPAGRHWRVSPDELDALDAQGLIEWSRTGNPRIKNYLQDKKGKVYQDIWTFKDPQNPTYPTEKNYDMLDLIIKQSSNPDSIVMDFFCGSGTTLLAAHSNGREFIGIDVSDEAIRACCERLPEGSYDYTEI